MIRALILAMVLSACASQDLKVKPGSLANRNLNVCVEFKHEILPPDRQAIELGVRDFIQAYNEEKHDMNLLNCLSHHDQVLTLQIREVKNLGPLDQAIYTAISIAGIAYPLSGGPLGWVLLGANSTKIELLLSNDISNLESPLKYNLHSFPYYGSVNSQRLRQVSSLKEMLSNIMQELNTIHNKIAKS